MDWNHSYDKQRTEKKIISTEHLSCGLPNLTLYRRIYSGDLFSIVVAECDSAPLLHTGFLGARVMKNDPDHQPAGRALWQVCVVSVCGIGLVQRESHHCKAFECLPFAMLPWGESEPEGRRC